MLYTFYDAFAKDGQSTEETKEYEKVKQALAYSFGTTGHPEDKIIRALEASLDHQELLDFLNNVIICINGKSWTKRRSFVFSTTR